MPAQKRSLAESLDEGETSQRHVKQSHRDREFKAEEHQEEDNEQGELQEQGEGGEAVQQHQRDDVKEKAEDSEENPSNGSEEKPEFVFVELPEIRKDVQCPICLALYPDIEKYEEEELEFREEEKTRNKQIQASIAKVVERQSEALVKRRSKDTPGAFVTRSQRNHRIAHSRRQNQGIELQESEDNEEENENKGEKDSSSTDEQCTELRQRRQKRHARLRPSQSSSSMASPDGGFLESDMDLSRENRGISSRQVSKPRKFTWGRGGFRSHTRYGSGSGSNNKISRSSRLSKLIDYLRSLDENTDEIDVHLMLVSLDKQSTPTLQQPHLCCRPTLSVKHLCEYVASQTSLPAEEVQILAVKGCCSTNCSKSADENLMCDELTMLILDPCIDELEILQAHETLSGLKSKCISKREHLILAYRQKETI